MPDNYDRTIKVPQSEIDRIKRMGMTAALAHAKSGQASKEFVEGAKRFYGGNRVNSNAGEPDASSGSSTPAAKPTETKTEAPKTQNISSTRVAAPAPPAIDRALRSLQSNVVSTKAAFEAKGSGSGRQKAAKTAVKELQEYSDKAPQRAMDKATGKVAGEKRTSNLKAALARATAEYNEKGSGRGRYGKVQELTRKLKG